MYISSSSINQTNTTSPTASNKKNLKILQNLLKSQTSTPSLNCWSTTHMMGRKSLNSKTSLGNFEEASTQLTSQKSIVSSNKSLVTIDKKCIRQLIERQKKQENLHLLIEKPQFHQINIGLQVNSHQSQQQQQQQPILKAKQYAQTAKKQLKEITNKTYMTPLKNEYAKVSVSDNKSYNTTAASSQVPDKKYNIKFLKEALQSISPIFSVENSPFVTCQRNLDESYGDQQQLQQEDQNHNVRNKNNYNNIQAYDSQQIEQYLPCPYQSNMNKIFTNLCKKMIVSQIMKECQQKHQANAAKINPDNKSTTNVDKLSLKQQVLSHSQEKHQIQIDQEDIDYYNRNNSKTILPQFISATNNISPISKNQEQQQQQQYLDSIYVRYGNKNVNRRLNRIKRQE